MLYTVWFIKKILLLNFEHYGDINTSYYVHYNALHSLIKKILLLNFEHYGDITISYNVQYNTLHSLIYQKNKTTEFRKSPNTQFMQHNC
jgi:hypothetical protein